MQDLIKYVLGIAAKSNVEKRQVGCIIVDSSNNIVGEGYNIEDCSMEQPIQHAETRAIESIETERASSDLRAYVTHPPCPNCATALTIAGIHHIEVVEAFMKFDGDKLRYDLIDGNFGRWLYEHAEVNYNVDATHQLKLRLYDITDLKKERIIQAMLTLAGQYDSLVSIEKGLAEVLTFGARKYKANNWKNCTDTGRYLAAAHRHLNAIISGESCDKETGFLHRNHLFCNLMFLFTLGLNYD